MTNPTNPTSPAPRMVRVVRVTTSTWEVPAARYYGDGGLPMTVAEIVAHERVTFDQQTEIAPDSSHDEVYAERYTGKTPAGPPPAMLEKVRVAVERGPLSGMDGLAYEPSARLAIATLTNLGGSATS